MPTFTIIFEQRREGFCDIEAGSKEEAETKFKDISSDYDDDGNYEVTDYRVCNVEARL